MYRVYIVKNYKAKTFIINSIDKYKKVINRQKANFLVVMFINLAGFENLRINLVDKKVYQLINDANKAEYYYNQVNNQRF